MSYVSISDLSKDFVQTISPVEALLGWLGADYKDQVVHAVSQVSLDIPKGKILGLIGESGCGKSTLGRMVAGLITPTAGTVRLDGKRFDLAGLEVSRRDQLRVQMVFQNPMASLNPRQKVLDIVTEGPVYHGLIAKSDREAFAADLSTEVGLSADALNRLPHQFSGGQRQRIGVARALSTTPDLLICDEPVAALDVSIQAQIINLLLDLKEKRNLTILFISHDLGVVRHLCDEVAVMYLGRIVEQASTWALFADPKHPYSRALLDEIPSIAGDKRRYAAIKGEIPSPLSPPDGCHFHPRCPIASNVCRTSYPARERHGQRLVACHHVAAVEPHQGADHPRPA